MGILRDMTERKKAEEALRKSEELFRSIVENSHAGILIVDDSYRLVYVNDELCRMFGYSREEIISQDFRRFLDEESRRLVADRYKKRQKGEKVPPRYDLNVVRKNGEKRQVEISSTVIKDSAGRMQTVAQILDITERQRAEEALKESKEKYRNLFFYSNDAIFIHDLDGNIIDVNQKAIDLFGYSKSEILSIKIPNLHPSEELEASRAAFEKISKQGFIKFEACFLKKNGETFPAEVSSSLFRIRGKKVIQGVVRDITERRRAEEKLQVEKARLDSLFESAQEGIVMADKEGQVIRVNTEFTRLFGYEPDQVLGRHLDELIWPKNEIYKGRRITKKVAEGESAAFEATRQRKDGTLIDVSVLASPIMTDGEVVAIYGIYRDITERKRAKERVRRQSAVLKAINEVFYKTLVCETEEDVARTCLAVAEELTGSQFGFIGKVNEKGRLDTIAQSETGWEACKIPKSNAALMINDMEIRGIWGKVLQDEQSLIVNDPASHPSRVGTPKGHPSINSFLGVPLKQAANTIGMIALANKKFGYNEEDKQAIEDLSVAFMEALTRKQTEEAIKKRKSQLELIHKIQNEIPMNMDTETILKSAAESIGKSFGYNKASVNLFDKDTDGIVHIVGWNKSGKPTPRGHRQKIGEGLIGKAAKLKRIIVANDVSKEPAYIAYYQTKTKSELAIPLVVQDHLVGVLDIQDVKKNVFTREDVAVLQSVANYIAYVIDEKKKEEVLRISEEKYRNLVELSPDAILFLDMKGTITSCNTFMTKATGYSKDDIIGKHLTELELLPAEDIPKYMNLINSAARGKVPKPFEVSWHHKDHTVYLAEVRIGFIKEKERNVGVQVVARDITERKRAEEKIRAALEEKEVMLREIHHRVKNNMQIISSLLRLQSRQIKNKKILDSFDVSQNRIRSMALIHESLYKSNDLARINFSDYINRLTIHLFSIYRTGMNSIELRVEVGDVFLDINRAIPCGLIINELVSNSLKHAFPDGRRGEIAVKMDMDKRGKYLLLVKDTGIGFPENVDFHQTDTLGMQLVTDLVKQLNGNIKLKRDGGTEFRIVF